MSESDTLEIIIIEEGHGMKDISCKHESRWVWSLPHEKGKWYQVIYAPNCDCEEPPNPYFSQLKEKDPLEKSAK